MRERGFTIVELLIVIVVIGVIAGLVIAAYTGIQDRAHVSKDKASERNLIQAIVAARNETGKTLLEITGNVWTADNCYSQPTGTDLAALPDTDPCWVNYEAALDAISTAAGNIDVRKLKDSYGRPFYIDENEGEDPFAPCQRDIISTYSHPFVNYGSNSNVEYLPISLPDTAC